MRVPDSADVTPLIESTLNKKMARDAETALRGRCACWLVCKQCLGAALSDKRTGKGAEKNKAWLSSSSRPHRRDDMEAMYHIGKQLVAGKGVSKDGEKA